MTFKYWETCAAQEELHAQDAEVPVSNPSAVAELSAVAEEADLSAEVNDRQADIDSPALTDEQQAEPVFESVEEVTPVPDSYDYAEQESVTGNSEFEEAVDSVYPGDELTDGVVPETEIVDLQEIRRDREDNARFNREVDEFFEEEERNAAGAEIKKKSLARKIFVDGLLGIPLLIATYLVAAAFLVLFALITAAFFVVGLAVLIGAVIVITNSFRIFSVNVPTALVCIGASIAAIGLGLMLFILCLLTAKYLLPLIIRLPIAFEKKLRLFKDGEEA